MKIIFKVSRPSALYRRTRFKFRSQSVENHRRYREAKYFKSLIKRETFENCYFKLSIPYANIFLINDMRTFKTNNKNWQCNHKYKTRKTGKVRVWKDARIRMKRKIATSFNPIPARLPDVSLISKVVVKKAWSLARQKNCWCKHFC